MVKILKDFGQNYKGFSLNLKGLWSKSQQILAKIFKHFDQKLGLNILGFWSKFYRIFAKILQELSQYL